MGKKICGDSLSFDMQHDHVLKKFNFELLTHPQWQGGGGGQNICFYVAAYVIIFNLICNMTMF